MLLSFFSIFCLFFNIAQTLDKIDYERLATMQLRVDSKLGALPPKVQNFADVTTYWFQQKFDHYAAQTTYWYQKYFVNGQFYKGGNSPIFLMVGGEGPISPAFMNGGMWYLWAQRYGAYLVQLEHRFYGESRPTRDASTQSLQYLRSQQALGDIANFIYQFSKTMGFTSNNKWILFGGSYPGDLVAWARLKYPQYVYGGISSSGPLLAKADFTEYNDVNRASLNYFSPGCAEEVTKAIQSMQQLMNSNAGLNTLAQKFPICQGTFNVNNAMDRMTLFQQIANPIARSVQYNNQLADASIYKVCYYMNNKNVADPVDRLAQWYEASKEKNDSCIYGSYQGMVWYYSQNDWNSSSVASNAKQWYFQTCNEFGFYQTSETKSSLFSDAIPYQYWTQLCYDIFGSYYNQQRIANNVEFTNNFYGGTDISIDRVVYMQGSIDPWHALGMVKNPTNQSPLYFIQGTSHCYDMLYPQSFDPPSLTQARSNAQKYLDYWLNYNTGK